MEEERALTIWQSIKNKDFFLFSADEVLEVFCLAANERISAYNNLIFPGTSVETIDFEEVAKLGRIEALNVFLQNYALKNAFSTGINVEFLDEFSVNSATAFLQVLGNSMKIPGFVRSFTTDTGFTSVDLTSYNAINNLGFCGDFSGDGVTGKKPFIFFRPFSINYTLEFSVPVTLPSGWTFDSWGLLPSGITVGDNFILQKTREEINALENFTDTAGNNLFVYNLGAGIFPEYTEPTSGFLISSSSSINTYNFDVSGGFVFV